MSNQIGEIISGTEADSPGDVEPDPSGFAPELRYYNRFSRLFDVIDSDNAPVKDNTVEYTNHEHTLHIEARTRDHARGLGIRAIVSGGLVEQYEALDRYQRVHATNQALERMEADYALKTGGDKVASAVETSTLMLFEPSDDAYVIGRWVDEDEKTINLYDRQAAGGYAALNARLLFETSYSDHPLAQRELPSLLSLNLLLGGIALFAGSIENPTEKQPERPAVKRVVKKPVVKQPPRKLFGKRSR